MKGMVRTKGKFIKIYKTIQNSKRIYSFKKNYIFDQVGAEPPPQLVLAAPVAGAAFHSSA